MLLAAAIEGTEAILEELQQSSALFLGNPVLLTELTEWVHDGRTARLILKCLDKTEQPQQAEVRWIGTIAHDRFKLSVDGGWRIYPNDPKPSPFTKAKSSFYTIAPSDERFTNYWSCAMQNTKQLIKGRKTHEIKNNLLNAEGNGIKIRHACFEVSLLRCTTVPTFI